MVHRCCISSCGMSVRVVEAKGLSYHKFPTKEPIRDQWVQAIIPHLDKPEVFKIVPRYTRVCSRHFRKKDYCMDAKKRARLNSNAVPSVFPRKGTPLVIPTVLPVSPKFSNPKSHNAPECVPGLSSSLKSENMQDKTGYGPSTSSAGFKSDESSCCSLPQVAKIETHQLDDLLGRTELVIESATIQDDHLVLTVMDPTSNPCETQESVSISNSDDQSQASGNGVADTTCEEGTGMKRRKRRKWNRTAFARPAKGKRKSVKTEPVPNEEEVDSGNITFGSSCSSTKDLVCITQERVAEVRSHEVLPNASVTLEDGTVSSNGTTLSNVTLLFSDLPNQSYHIGSVEQELLQSIQAVSLKSNGDTDDVTELQCTSSSTTTTDEAYPYNNLIPAFLHHSSEESLFSNESQTPGGPNEYNFQAISHQQLETDLNSTAEDDSLRFELVDLRIDPEIPSAPAPSYLDIDELAQQLNSSLFTDGKIPLFTSDSLNLGGDSSSNINIAEDLFTDPTEDINQKLEDLGSEKPGPLTPVLTSSNVVSSPQVPVTTSIPDSKQSPKKCNPPRTKGKAGKGNKSLSCMPPPPLKETKLRGVTKRPKKDKIAGKFSVERFKNSDKDIEYYTGFISYRNFEAFFRSLEAYTEKLCITDATYGVNNLPTSVDASGTCSSSQSSGEDGANNIKKFGNETPKKRSCQGRSMSRINELFMTIIRLRRKLPEKVLGHMFFISQPTVSRVVRAWTVLLSKIIDSYPVESSSTSKTSLKEHSYTSKGLGVPESFRELFYSDLAKSIVVTSLNPKKVKSKSSSSSSVRNKKSKMSSTLSLGDLDASSTFSDGSDDRSGDLDSDFFAGLRVTPNTTNSSEQSSLFEFE